MLIFSINLISVETYTTVILTILKNICYINLGGDKSTMNAEMFIRNALSWQKRLQTSIGTNSDRYFDVLSASECLRFMK